MKDQIRASVFFLLGLVFVFTPAFAAEKAFYQGKTITFLINFSAGGPTDIEGRIVARHLARHIPGNPLIVVQNMSGAGGVMGINFLGEKAKSDALTLGYFYRALQSSYDEELILADRPHEGAVHRLGGKRDRPLNPLRCPTRDQKAYRHCKNGTFSSRRPVFRQQ